LKANFKLNIDSGENMNKLANKVLDIMNILLDSFVVICDSKKGFNNTINEEINIEMHYDVVEEMPNKNEIISILKEIKTFMTIDNIWELEKNSDITIFNKFLNLTLKSVKVFEKLSFNFYGQLIILHSDYPSNNVIKTNISKPIFIFNDLIRGIVYRLNSDKKYCLSHGILIEILESIVIFSILLMFDLNHFETNQQNYMTNFNFFKFHKFFLPAEANNRLNLVTTETRLKSLIKLLIGEQDTSLEESIKIISNLFSQITESIAYRNQEVYEKDDLRTDFILSMKKKISANLAGNVSFLATLFNDFSNFKLIKSKEDSIDSSEAIQTVRLPNARKIYEKLEIIYKFYELYQTQNYSYQLPFSITNCSVLNPQSSLINPSTVIKHNINDFEKLLNWKKYRIYLSKSDNLITRTSLFDIDYSLKLTPEDSIQYSNIDLCFYSDSLAYKKKFTHLNSEPFQQFYNQMLNESLVLNKFANISYSITSAIIHKHTIFTSNYYYNPQIIQLVYRNLLNFKYDIDYIKNKTGIREIQTSLSKIKTPGMIAPLLRTKKKINSKFNTFIYKPKFDKMPKPILTSSVATSSSSTIYFNLNLVSIRDTNRYASVVSGRTLSVHMDKFNPTQTVVNPTYASLDEANKEHQQQEPIEKEFSVEDSKSEISKKEEVTEKVIVEKAITSSSTQGVTTETPATPTAPVITNPQLTFDNRMMTNSLQVNATASTMQSKIETTKIQNMNTNNIVNPQLNLRMMNPIQSYSQGYGMMNPNLNINISGTHVPMQMPNQIQATPNTSQSTQFNPYQMNQPQMNPNIMIGQTNQMPYNYSGMRPPVNPMNMNPQMNQMYNQNLSMMNKNMMSYSQMPGQTHFNYSQINQYQNQHHQQQPISQMMPVGPYGQNISNMNMNQNMNRDFNRINQQQSTSMVQNLQIEERKNVITPTNQNNTNQANASSNNTNILSNILQVLQNPDLKQMLGKINQPAVQGGVDDKSKDPRIRKKK